MRSRQKRGAESTWDLGIEVGVFGTPKPSCLSLQMIALYNPFNDCVKLCFIPN